MPIEFTRCEGCGIIFPNQDGKDSQCPKCRHEQAQHVSGRDLLRVLKNALRDAQSRGVFLNIRELSQLTEVDESCIWGFIHSGDIDTASLNDPEVRSFLARRKKELMKASAKPAEAEPKLEEGTKRRSGFHLHADDDPGKG